MSPCVWVLQEHCWQFSSWSHACWLEKIHSLAFYYYYYLTLFFFWAEICFLASAIMLSWWGSELRPWTKHWLQLHASSTSWLEVSPFQWPGPRTLQMDELEVSAQAFWGLGEENRLLPPRADARFDSTVTFQAKRNKTVFLKMPQGRNIVTYVSGHSRKSSVNSTDLGCA